LDFSAPWIAQNVHDLLNQANVEYAEWLGEHGAAANPPGWLIQRGRWRALNLAKRESRQSGPPLDSVIHTAEDPRPTPEDAVLDRDRHRRIEKALSNIPEKDRRLIALVYYEGQSIRAAGRLLGWGKSNADKHHAKAMERLQALLGPRDLLSPSIVGFVAQAMAVRDRGKLVGGMVNRITAAVQDLGAVASRVFGSASGTAGEAARRATPLTDAGSAGGSGAGRAIAQCGAIATAAICSALVVASPPVEHLLGHGPARPAPDRSPRPHTDEVAPSGEVAPSIEPPTRSSAAAREEEARRIEGHRRRLDKRAEERRRRRRARISRARRARQAKARAARKQRKESREAAEEVAPEVTEPVPETVAPEEGAPPPATGAQTREEFGHL
jgi:RNA polymerase sigma factor (sigma-70 family)